mmetsp:Transcript_1190/g.4896  ORF Transcript_1190/g.4896 Transcript_1190/m.4896 type:complete len:216 (+) Transcript_1190:1540-2187(+)
MVPGVPGWSGRSALQAAPAASDPGTETSSWNPTLVDCLRWAYGISSRSAPVFPLASRTEAAHFRSGVIGRIAAAVASAFASATATSWSSLPVKASHAATPLCAHWSPAIRARARLPLLFVAKFLQGTASWVTGMVGRPAPQLVEVARRPATAHSICQRQAGASLAWLPWCTQRLATPSLAWKPILASNAYGASGPSGATVRSAAVSACVRGPLST